MSAELKTSQRHSFFKGALLGLFLGSAYVMGWWAYWDFQPDPLPEYIGCTIGDGPNAGQECPPLKLKDGGYVPWDS